MTPAQVAAICGVKLRTVQHWQTMGTGPDSFLLRGRSRRYRASAVAAWVAEQEQATA